MLAKKFTTYGYRHQTSGGGRGCLWTSFMDSPNTLKRWNELLDYLQTNDALRKSKFINYTRAVYYSKTTVENCKSFGAVRIGYVRYDISKDLAKNLFFCLVIPTSLNPSL